MAGITNARGYHYAYIKFPLTVSNACSLSTETILIIPSPAIPDQTYVVNSGWKYPDTTPVAFKSDSSICVSGDIIYYLTSSKIGYPTVGL